MFACGSLANKTSSTVHHTLNFVYTFSGIPANRESQSSKRERTTDMTTIFVASVVRNWRKDPTLRISLANSVNLMPHGEPIVNDTLVTGKITKRYVTLANF